MSVVPSGRFISLSWIKLLGIKIMRLREQEAKFSEYVMRGNDEGYTAYSYPFNPGTMTTGYKRNNSTHQWIVIQIIYDNPKNLGQTVQAKATSNSHLSNMVNILCMAW